MRPGSVPCPALGPVQIPASPGRGTELAFSQGVGAVVTQTHPHCSPGQVTLMPASPNPSFASNRLTKPKWSGCWED